MENNKEYFLRNLNFQSGFGVDLAMINYAPRNIFYKNSNIKFIIKYMLLKLIKKTMNYQNI